jgi:AAA domain-containing protein
MPIELRNMEVEPPASKLKIMLVGGEQNGKSRLAATGRKPILFHDFDNKRESLAGIPGVFVITYVDPIWPMQPTASQDFLTTIGKLEQSIDLRDLGFDVPKGTILKTNVIDSIQTLAKAAKEYAIYNSPDLRREISFGGHKVFVGKGWDSVNAEMAEVEKFTLRLMALPTDTIAILHETEEEAADSTPEKKKFTGRIGVYPPRYQALIKYFPEVWRVKLTQSVGSNNQMAYKPKVYPLPSYEFDSGTTLMLDAVEDPNIEAMIAKHNSRLKQNSHKALAQGK